MSVLEELLGTIDQIGASGTALDGLADTLKMFNSTALETSRALTQITAPAASVASSMTSAGKATEALTSAQKGAAPAVLNTGRAGTAAARGLDSLKQSATQALDNLKPAGGILGAITAALESMGPKGKAAAVILGIVVSVVTAGARAFGELVRSAIAFSQEKDALAETFAAITDGAQSGLDVVNDLSDVAAKLPFNEGKVLGWGKALAAAGKSGDALVQGLNAVASSAAIMQDGGSAALAFSKRLQTAADAGEKIKLDRRMQRMLAETGVRATELAKALGLPEEKLSSMSIDAAKLGDAFEKALIGKGAGALNKLSLTWGSITGKLADAWGDLFEDLGPAVEPLMTAIRDLFAEFSAGTTLQGAAKSVFTSFFTTIFGWATRATKAIHLGFLEVQIAALKAYIFLAPIVRILRAILTNAEVLRGLKIIFTVIAAAIGLVVAAIAAVGATFLAIWTVVSFVVGAISTAISFVVGVVGGLVSSLMNGGTAGAKGFITGIVEGLRAGAGMVVDAVKQLAAGAVNAFTTSLGIKSPSRVMKAHGRQLPAGAAEGVDEGSVQLEESMDGMWELPRAKRQERPRAERGPAGRSATFNNCSFWDTDEGKIRALWEKFLEQEEAAGPEPEPA